MVRIFKKKRDSNFVAYDNGSPNTKMPQDVGYLLFYNGTYSNAHGYYSPAIQVMKAVDEAILQIKTRDSGASIDVNTQNFPRAKLRIAGLD